MVLPKRLRLAKPLQGPTGSPEDALHSGIGDSHNGLRCRRSHRLQHRGKQHEGGAIEPASAGVDTAICVDAKARAFENALAAGRSSITQKMGKGVGEHVWAGRGQEPDAAG
jgi:hypothetical protein